MHTGEASRHASPGTPSRAQLQGLVWTDWLLRAPPVSPARSPHFPPRCLVCEEGLRWNREPFKQEALQASLQVSPQMARRLFTSGSKEGRRPRKSQGFWHEAVRNRKHHTPSTDGAHGHLVLLVWEPSLASRAWAAGDTEAPAWETPLIPGALGRRYGPPPSFTSPCPCPPTNEAQHRHSGSDPRPSLQTPSAGRL